jgi:hypothetical protein
MVTQADLALFQKAIFRSLAAHAFALLLEKCTFRCLVTMSFFITPEITLDKSARHDYHTMSAGMTHERGRDSTLA